MEQLFEKYINIQLFLTNYRKYQLVDDEKFLSFEDFRNKMQLTGYVMHRCIGIETQELLDVYIFKKHSKYIKTTSEFIKLLDRYREPRHIILFTKEKLSIYLKKAIKRYSDLKIDNYLHKHFIVELNKGPLCSKHTILSQEEVKQVCFDLMAHGHKLPAISIEDPQVIWIGGKVNDVIKIEANSEITGKTIRYRIVTPATGKVEQSTNIKKIVFERSKEGEEEQGKPTEGAETTEAYDEYEEDYEEDYEA